MPIIGREIIRYGQVQSTNDLARTQGQTGAPEGLVVMAEEQVAGRGRLGRQWLAPRGSSLQFSVLLRPDLPPSLAFRLTQMAALAVSDALRQELGLAPALKWPNDVLLNYKKCAGILIETALEGDALSFAVLGIGLNVNFSMGDLPELAPFATTVADALGHPVDRDALARALFAQLDDYYARLKAGADFYSEWRSRLVTLGHIVRIATPDGIKEGIAEQVAPDGALLLRQGAKLIPFYAGDVTILKDNS